MSRYLVILICIVFCSCSKKNTERLTIDLPFYNTADLTPRWIELQDSGYSAIHTIAPFKFVNQNGDTVTADNFTDKIYVANFFFSICPGVCPKMNGNLKLVQETFATDDRVKILSHSVMPWVDSVAQLQKYAIRNDINPDIWQLVTGDKEDIYQLARESYFADEGFGKGLTTLEDFLHTETVILVDRQRRIRGIYNGTLPMDISRMIDDIRVIL
ncbi:MAG: protein SCO1/2 [Cyclobacteriaceae bacterium]|jgi:protein SCO1/2